MIEGERRDVLPYIMVKPNSGPQLEALLETIDKNGLTPTNVYSTDKWAEIARQIYQKNIDRIGREFKVGLEGHIRLVNLFFGNRAVVLLLDGAKEKLEIEDALSLTQKVKRDLRSSIPAGERLEDIIVFMNLDKIDIGCNPDGTCPTGVLGIQSREGNFKPISGNTGTWDFYYFKYVHVPDTVSELCEELDTLNQMGVFAAENAISSNDLQLMSRLRTVLPPSLFK